MTKIISILNHKGGVGKTTSSVNIGAGLYLKKKKVLLIDLDAQANLTLHLGKPVDQERTIYGALKGQYPLPVQSLKNGFDIVTSTLDLSAAEMELSNEAGREYLLKYLIQPITSNYDYILIDCPPSLGLLTLNALSVSTNMIIPVELSSFALAGMAKLFEVIDKVKKRLNPELSTLNILMTKVDTRKTIHKNIKDLLRKDYKDILFKTEIRTNVSLEESQVMQKDIFSYAPKSFGAQDYEQVCKEILKNK